jgi:hypothetical protein
MRLSGLTRRAPTAGETPASLCPARPARNSSFPGLDVGRHRRTHLNHFDACKSYSTFSTTSRKSTLAVAPMPWNVGET